jgi:hypothetical protein
MATNVIAAHRGHVRIRSGIACNGRTHTRKIIEEDALAGPKVRVELDRNRAYADAAPFRFVGVIQGGVEKPFLAYSNSKMPVPHSRPRCWSTFATRMAAENCPVQSAIVRKHPCLDTERPGIVALSAEDVGQGEACEDAGISVAVE